jgi:hypothetical protein
MKLLPDTFAVHGVGDRWFVIAPAEHEFRVRTFERMEVQALEQARAFARAERDKGT